MRADPLKLALLFGTLVAAPLSAQAGPDASPLHEMRWGRATFLLAEVLDLAPGTAQRPLAYDLVGWTGGVRQRLWVKADGAIATVGRAAHGEYQVLYGRLVAPFWDAQVGVRVDVQQGATRTDSRLGAAVGLQGLAPGWFELEPSLFLGTDGVLSADLTGSLDVYLMQRVILQPRLEITGGSHEDSEFGVGAGLRSGSLGLRTRLEVRREIAPYLGVVWERRFGRTAEIGRAAGVEAGEVLFVVGFRLWR